MCIKCHCFACVLVCTLSCGCALGAEDRYKIDKTAMGEIMNSSKTSAGTVAVGKTSASDTSIEASSKARTEKEKEDKEEELGQDSGEETIEMLEVELEDILRSCVDVATAKTDLSTHPLSGDLLILLL